MGEGTGEQSPTGKSKNPIAFAPMEIYSVKPITRATQLTKPTITTFGVSSSIYPAADDFTTELKQVLATITGREQTIKFLSLPMLRMELLG